MLKPALIVGITLVVAALIAPLQVAAVTEASSPRIWIHAQFYSGGMGDGPPDPWELTIASCGDAMQQTFIFSTEGKRKNETISKRFTLSSQDLDELIASKTSMAIPPMNSRSISSAPPNRLVGF